MANKSEFFGIWGGGFVASDTLSVCLLKHNPLFRHRLLWQALCLREQRHLLITLDIAYMKTVNWVFGKVVDVNYIFPGFVTTVTITPYSKVPGVLSAHCLKQASINWWVSLLLMGEHISLNALAYTNLYCNVFLSLRWTTLPTGAHSWSKKVQHVQYQEPELSDKVWHLCPQHLWWFMENVLRVWLQGAMGNFIC